jgi:DNA-binding MarR family transcriptional regulator
MPTEKPTIESLFSDSGPFDEAEVVKALQPHVTIQKSTNEIFFKGGQLSTQQRVLAYGLAKKLLRSKSLIETESITAQELHKKTGIKKGTIDPAFKVLREKGLLVGKRDYEIPTSKIHDIIEILSSGEE